MKLCINQIKANTWNCNILGEQERQNLKQRMTQDGQEKTVPIIVRKLPNTDLYELVDGEHRWEIAKELGWITIEALIQEADELQARALCISYNRIRGRVDWIKLYDVVTNDLAQGIDIVRTYQESLTPTEVQWLLSLDRLIPEARTILEKSIKKYPELSLEHLHLIAQFPPYQQKSLVEKFKNAIVSHALLKALNATLQPPTQQQTPLPPYLKQTNPQHQLTNKLPNQTHQTNNNREFDPDHSITLQKNTTYKIEGEGQALEDKTEEPTEEQRAWLVSGSYCCECGRHYHTNFRDLTVSVQKENLFFNLIDITPHTFMVHCNKCNTDHQYTIDPTNNKSSSDGEWGVVEICCSRCKPMRKGLLDVNTGKAFWFGI